MLMIGFKLIRHATDASATTLLIWTGILMPQILEKPITVNCKCVRVLGIGTHVCYNSAANC